MLKKLIDKITYMQVTIVRGLLFSLYLVFLINNEILLKDNSALYIYLVLFAIRVLFNYNLEDYKYSLVPIHSITMDTMGDDEKVIYELLTKDLVEGTPEYKCKTSAFYWWTHFITNVVSTLTSGLILIISLFYLVADLLGLLKGLDIHMVTYVIVGSLVVALIYILFSSGNKVKREEIKGELVE
jgi:uncharacterized membrane protein YuzA (DUF378 family)